MINTIIIGIFLFIILGCSDQSIRSKELLLNKKDGVLIKEEVNTNCLILTNPEWVDDSTDNRGNGIYQSKYDRIFLFGFVKNICTDTIDITTDYFGLDQIGLYVGHVIRYYKNSEGNTLRADTQIDSIYKILPNDSMYLGITEFNSYEIDDLDYLEIIVEYRKGGTAITQSIPVFSYNITSSDYNWK